MAALTAPLPALTRAPSRAAVTPRAQKDVAASVSQVPPPPLRRSSRRVSVRAPLPAWRLRRNVPSSAPSAAYVVGFAPTLSRSLPRNASASVGAGGATVNPPCLIATWPSGFVTVTSRGPIVALEPIEIETDNWVDEVTVVEVTVTSAPKAAVAPGWKLEPVTVTANAAPGEPVLGVRLEIAGISGRVTVAAADVTSAKLAVTVKPEPLVNAGGFGSPANTWTEPPSVMAALTAPLPALTRVPSRVAVTPRAQKDVAASVSQVPPPPFRRSSRRVGVRAPLPDWSVRRNVPSSAPSAAYVVGFAPTLSRSLPRNARPSVGAGGETVKPATRVAVCPPVVTVTSRAPIVAALSIAMATDSWVDETNVVELTVMPLLGPVPNAAVAPDWKLVPVTVTVRLAPGAPLLGDTAVMEGICGRLTVVAAEVPSAKLTVRVKPAPLLNGVGLRSEANTKKAPPSATGRFTVPLPAFTSAPSRLVVVPSAQ